MLSREPFSRLSSKGVPSNLVGLKINFRSAPNERLTMGLLGSKSRSLSECSPTVCLPEAYRFTSRKLKCSPVTISTQVLRWESREVHLSAGIQSPLKLYVKPVSPNAICCLGNGNHLFITLILANSPSKYLISRFKLRKK